MAAEHGEVSSSDSDEFRPDWTAEESEGSGNEQVFAAQAGRVVKLEVDEEDTSSQVAVGAFWPSAPGAGPLASL
eukprot:4637235-Alexandrium_andersonii.AAC.1